MNGCRRRSSPISLMALFDRSLTFVAMQQSPETQRAYGRDLRVYFDFLDQNDIDPEDVSENDLVMFRDYLVESFAPNGAARVWNTVRTFHKYADTHVSSFMRVKAPKRTTNVVPRVPSDEDVDALWGASEDNPERRLIIALLLNGLRASEVANLRFEDIEFHEGAMVIRVVGKGQKERLVPITSEVERALDAHNATLDPYKSRSSVFADMNYRKVEHAVYKTAEYAGITGMHPHALRHHYATRLIRAGVETPYVQRLLGHANISTTNTYIGLDLGDLIAASRRDPRNA